MARHHRPAVHRDLAQLVSPVGTGSIAAREAGQNTPQHRRKLRLASITCSTAPAEGLACSAKSFAGARLVSGSGSPLCQDTAGRRVLSWVSAGPGSDFSEEPAWG